MNARRDILFDKRRLNCAASSNHRSVLEQIRKLQPEQPAQNQMDLYTFILDYRVFGAGPTTDWVKNTLHIPESIPRIQEIEDFGTKSRT